jgi:HEPN domain-containing protein
MAEPSMAELTLAAARRDADTYALLVDHAEAHDAILGFHAQQAVEKALKSVMFGRGIAVPRTHNLALLLDLLADAGVPAPPHVDVLDSLNPFAVQARYGTVEVGTLDRRAVAAWLVAVLGWAAAGRDA